MSALWQNECLTFTFYEKISKGIPNWKTFVKEVFDLIISLNSDKMTALGPTDSLAFTFHETFANSLPKWTTLLKKFIWFNV